MLNVSKKVWVNWKLETGKDGKPTKVPYQPNGNRASSTDKRTWYLYDEVKEKAEFFSGIGIVFAGASVGVDLDHVLSQDTKDGVIVYTIDDLASRNFVNLANTYTEISPSGTGLHVIFNLSEPFEPLGNHHTPKQGIKYECYSSKRFFTVTEKIFENRADVRTVDAIEMARLLAPLGYPWKAPKTLPPTQMDTIGLEESKIVDIMFSAANGAKARKLWAGDTSAYNNDVSSADMALCCLLAFYSGKKADVIERLWLSSPAGQREKTQRRKDYRNRTIAAAVAYTDEVFVSDRSYDNAVDFIVKKTKSGDQILLCTENIQIFLNSSPEFSQRFRFDEFTQRIEFKKVDAWCDLSDADVLYVQSVISKIHPAFGMVSRMMVQDAIHSNAYNHTFDSVKNYMTSLVWDGTPRVDTWLSRAYGAPDDAYHTAIGSNWLKGLVQRAMEPGCKFDYVLVLEGPQGAKKSMSLAALAAPWHVETTQTPDNRDFFMLLLGRLVVEFSEGETMSRADTKKLKAIITMQEDVLRLPYAHSVSTMKRRNVFAMTTNEEHYLKDDTGNRRWLPFTIGENIDVDWIKENRNQLFAEAFHRVITLHEPTWEFPKEETEAAQAQRRTVDPQAEEIEEWYVSITEEERAVGITTKMAFDAVFNKNQTVILREQKMTRADEMRIASILKTNLRMEKKRTMHQGVYKYRFFPTEKTPKHISIEEQFASAAF